MMPNRSLERLSLRLGESTGGGGAAPAWAEYSAPHRTLDAESQITL
jgi:hypothetical protein